MKKIRLKKVMIGVACAFSIGSIIYFGGQFLEQKEMIAQQIQVIDEHRYHIQSLEEETGRLIAESESARQRRGELEEHINSTRGRIEQLRTEITELEELKAKSPLARGLIAKGGSGLSGTTIKVKVTGYCPCAYCCGEWAYKNPGITASGTKAKYGTIAAPTSIPFGTQMKIEGYGDQIFTVEDTGSAVVYRDGVYVIDMWMPTHEQAYNVGNSVVEATILN